MQLIGCSSPGCLCISCLQRRWMPEHRANGRLMLIDADRQLECSLGPIAWYRAQAGMHVLMLHKSGKQSMFRSLRPASEVSPSAQALVGAYGADAVRYYFAREVEFGRDGDFAEERFRAIVNSDLANTVGNLLNRTLGLLKKNCGGAVPGDSAAIPQDHPLRSCVAEQARFRCTPVISCGFS